MSEQDTLSTMVINAAKVKGFTGVMKLSVAVKKKTGLTQPRVSRVWNGKPEAKMGDYITVMKFLNTDINIKLEKEIKK